MLNTCFFLATHEAAPKQRSFVAIHRLHGGGAALGADKPCTDINGSLWHSPWQRYLFLGASLTPLTKCCFKCCGTSSGIVHQGTVAPWYTDALVARCNSIWLVCTGFSNMCLPCSCARALSLVASVFLKTESALMKKLRQPERFDAK